MSDIITITATENTDDINIIANEVTENISIAVYENLYDGSTLSSGLTFQDGNLKLLDTDKSNTLGISLGSNLTSNRTLTLLVPDGDSTLDISSGNLTLSGNNSGDVTLAGSLDYITLSGQELTLGSINLTTDVTSVLPVANGGTGVTTATGTSSVVRQNSPILTGSPRVPTQLRGTNNTIIASTEYVNDLINNRITVSQSAPTNPEVGDAWIYLSEDGYSLLSETYTTDFTEQFLLAETAEEARTVLEIGNSSLQPEDIGVTVQGYSSVLENTTASFTTEYETTVNTVVEKIYHNTATLNAVINTHYILDTTSNAITVTLPETPTNGSTIGFSDYVGTFTSNTVTINRSGTDTIFNGVDTDLLLNSNYQIVELTYWNGNWSVTKAETFVDNGIGGSPAILSDISGIPGANVITNIVSISQVDYDALVTVDPNTLYYIVG